MTVGEIPLNRNGIPLTGDAEGENIVFSIRKHIDVFKTLRRFATFVKNRMITGIVEVTQDPEQAGSTLKILSLRLRGKRIMPPYKESLYALFGLKYDSNIEDNYICQNARVAQDIGKTNYIFI